MGHKSNKNHYNIKNTLYDYICIISNENEQIFSKIIEQCISSIKARYNQK